MRHVYAGTSRSACADRSTTGAVQATLFVIATDPVGRPGLICIKACADTLASRTACPGKLIADTKHAVLDLHHRFYSSETADRRFDFERGEQGRGAVPLVVV